jgi:hypothetical protein
MTFALEPAWSQSRVLALQSAGSAIIVRFIQRCLASQGRSAFIARIQAKTLFGDKRPHGPPRVLVGETCHHFGTWQPDQGAIPFNYNREHQGLSS